MSLVRSFRRQSWFVRFPTGEIDLVDGSAISRGFDAGTLGYETPVCAVGSQVWLPLRIHATTEAAFSHARSSSDDEITVPPPAGPWRVRQRPLPSLAVKKRPLFGALVLGALTLIAAALYLSSALDERAAHARSLPKPAEVLTNVAPPSADLADTRPASPQRSELTPEQRRRLLVQDTRLLAQRKELPRSRPNDWARLRATRSALR